MIYHLGVDQGTTNTKVVLYNGKKIIYTVTKKIPINFTREGWVEQNANLIIDNIIFCIRQIIKISKVNINKIESAGIANQTETFVVWDKKLKELSTSVNVEWNWVKSHSDDPLNEQADKLAKKQPQFNKLFYINNKLT